VTGRVDGDGDGNDGNHHHPQTHVGSRPRSSNYAGLYTSAAPEKRKAGDSTLPRPAQTRAIVFFVGGRDSAL
jgi:hypothetical protein